MSTTTIKASTAHHLTSAAWTVDAEDDYLLPDWVRIDLEMERLKAVTDLAWHEAKESTQ